MPENEIFEREFTKDISVKNNRNYYLTIKFQLDDEDYHAMNYHSVGLGGKLLNPSGSLPTRLLLGVGEEIKGKKLFITSRFAKLQKQNAEDPDGEVTLTYTIKIEEGDTLIWKEEAKDDKKIYHSVFTSKIKFQ